MADDSPPRRERPLKMAERTTPAKLKSTKPPMWSSKVHGVPNKYTPATDLDKRPPKHALVTYDGGAGGRRPLSGGGALQKQDTRLGKPLVEARQVLESNVARMEVELRRNLRELAIESKLHETEKSILIRTFECFDYERSGKVSKSGCAKALKSLGVDLDSYEMDYLFDKYGQDMNRMMPYDVFTNRLFTSKNRILAWTGLKEDAFKGTDAKDELAYNGKIRYAKGKYGSVYTPEDWDPAVAERAKRAPDAHLQLEHAYGYRADDKVLSPNLFYTASREVAYFTAGVGVVFNKESMSQRFFLGHSDDILCLALDPTKNIAATGQRVPQGGLPYVCVWDVNSMRQLQRLDHPKEPGDAAVIAVAFSHDGTFLVSLQSDENHYITVWDWREGKQLMHERTQKAPGGKPKIFGIAWNGHIIPNPELEASKFDFCTYGVHGLSFWNFKKTVKDGSVRYNRTKKFSELWTCVPGSEGPEIVEHNCSVWLPNGDCLSGTKKGQIWIWRGTKVYDTPIDAHRGEVKALVLRPDGNTLISGGSQGTIIEWDVRGDKPQRLRVRVIPAPFLNAKPPGIKALDCYPGSQVYIMGSMQSDIYEVDADPNILVKGHDDRLDAIAAHPSDQDQLASASFTGRCYIWSASERELKFNFGLPGDSARGQKATCITYAPSGHEICVGFDTGTWFVYNTQHRCTAHVRRPPREAKRNKYGEVMMEDQGVMCLKYSPEGETLAVGDYEQVTTLYRCRPDLTATEADATSRERFVKTGRCVGHSSTIKSIDWDRSGTVLQTVSTAQEMLYWWGNPRSIDEIKALGLWEETRTVLPRPGEQLTDVFREYTMWDTWTSVIGFPVMGIYPLGKDLKFDDMNAVSVSRGTGGRASDADRGPVVVVATDKGQVLMYNYPAVIDGAPYYSFNGHSSFAQNVTFLADDSRVVSAGGADRSMLQWSVVWKNTNGFVGYRQPSVKGGDELARVRGPAAPAPAPKDPAAGRIVGTAGGADAGAVAARDREQAAKIDRLQKQLARMEAEQAKLRAELQSVAGAK